MYKGLLKALWCVLRLSAFRLIGVCVPVFMDVNQAATYGTICIVEEVSPNRAEFIELKAISLGYQ